MQNITLINDVRDAAELQAKKRKKTYGNYGEFLTYRNRITKMVLAFVIAQHTANVEFRRIIVI